MKDLNSNQTLQFIAVAALSFSSVAVTSGGDSQPEHLVLNDYNLDRQERCLEENYPANADNFTSERVWVNFTVQNDRDYNIAVTSRVSLYRPNGARENRFTDDVGSGVAPGFWRCFNYYFDGYPRCPGRWKLRVEIDERATGFGGATGWQTIIEREFTVLDNAPDATGGSVSQATASPSDVVTLTVEVRDAAQYTGTWKDGGAGGTFDPPTVNVNADCVGNRVHTTRYTVPDKKGQEIGFRFDVQNSIDADSRNVGNLQVRNRFQLEPAVSPANGGTIDPGAPMTYDEGTVVPVVATPNAAEGFEFDSWSEDAAGDQPNIEVTMDRAKNVTGNFRLMDVTLTLGVAPPGVGAISESVMSPMPWGTEVELVATSTDANYEFSHWECDGAGEDSALSISMNGDRKVRGVFQLRNRALARSLSPSDGGQVVLDPPGGLYPHGATVTLEAVPAVGFRFAGWDEDLQGDQNPSQLLMDADRGVTALFEEIEYEVTFNISPAEGGVVYVAETGEEYSNGEPLPVRHGDTLNMEARAADHFRFFEWGGDPIDPDPMRQITITANQSVELSFDPDSQLGLGLESDLAVAHVGQRFTMRLVLSRGVDVVGHEIDLLFDETVLRVVSVSEGTFLKGGDDNPTFWLPPHIDNTLGALRNILNLRVGGGGLDGDGVVAEIEIEVIAQGEGDTLIRFDRPEAKVSDASAASIPIAAFTDFNLQIGVSHYSDWADASGLPENDRAPEGDFSKNGASNFITYVFGGDPTSAQPVLPDATPFLPWSTNAVFQDGMHFTIHYFRRHDATARGLDYAVEYSTDGLTWEPANSTRELDVQEISGGTRPAAGGGTVEQVSVVLIAPRSNWPRLMGRVQVADAVN